MIRSDLQSLSDEEIAVSEVRICGRQDARRRFYRGAEYVALRPKVKVEMLVPAAGLANVIAVFSRGGQSADTGSDDKILIYDVAKTIRLPYICHAGSSQR